MRIREGANHTPRFRRTLKESHPQVNDPSKNIAIGEASFLRSTTGKPRFFAAASRHRRVLPTVGDRQATLCCGGQSPSALQHLWSHSIENTYVP